MAYLEGAKRIKRLGLRIAIVGTLLALLLDLIPLYTKPALDNGFFAPFLFYPSDTRCNGPSASTRAVGTLKPTDYS
jgi:hypothetical protein